MSDHFAFCTVEVVVSSCEGDGEAELWADEAWRRVMLSLVAVPLEGRCDGGSAGVGNGMARGLTMGLWSWFMEGYALEDSVGVTCGGGFFRRAGLVVKTVHHLPLVRGSGSNVRVGGRVKSDDLRAIRRNSHRMAPDRSAEFFRQVAIWPRCVAGGDAVLRAVAQRFFGCEVEVRESANFTKRTEGEMKNEDFRFYNGDLEYRNEMGAMTQAGLEAIRGNSHLKAPDFVDGVSLTLARIRLAREEQVNATFGLPICLSSLHTPPLICAGLKRLYRL